MAEGEWRTDIHPGYKTKIIKTKNATIEINSPLLEPAERARREARVIDAMKSLGKELKQ